MGSNQSTGKSYLKVAMFFDHFTATLIWSFKQQQQQQQSGGTNLNTTNYVIMINEEEKRQG